MEKRFKPKIMGLVHRDGCSIYDAPIEKTETGRHQDARRYCTCDAYNQMHKGDERNE